MKTYSFLVSFIFATAMANGFSTEEHIKRFFCSEHRALLPDLTSLKIEDQNAGARVPQNNDSTRCLPHSEPDCKKLDAPEFLTKNASFHEFQEMTINYVLASAVVFNKSPWNKCQFMLLYLFDCCRSCNAVYKKCMDRDGALYGGPEHCYRESYKCMCICMDKNSLPEIAPFAGP